MRVKYINIFMYSEQNILIKVEKDDNIYVYLYILILMIE